MISIVVSAYNEEEVLPLFYKELKNQLNALEEDAEIVFVNDGSADKTINILNSIAANDPAVKVVNFSRNFGHEAAMLAGLNHAEGEAIICMDADLQHPPAEIKNMVAAYKAGAQVVLMVRDERKDYSFIKQGVTTMFYKFLNKFSEYQFEANVSDFFLVSSKVSKVICKEFPEFNKFLRGIIQNIGFEKKRLHYVAPARAAGQSKYSLYKLMLFSFSAITTTSLAPLRLGIFAGMMFGGFATLLAIYSVFMKFFSQPFSGYTTIIVFLSFSFSILFFVIGIIGEYIANVFKEVKSRPPYIVSEVISYKKEDAAK